ncbi:MAG: hypothetical protein ACI837_003139 [Crocinitomicaceae bacterium]
MRPFLDLFESTVASNDREALMNLMYPVCRTVYGDSDEMMGEFFNVVDADAHIEYLDYREVERIEFESIIDYTVGYDVKYALRYTIYMKDGRILHKDSWRINVVDVGFYLSSAVG